jgi:uncharacterized protein (DUF433 family)
MPIIHPLTWADCPAVEWNPQRVSGAWVFRGTRVPVAALFQNLEDGVSLAEFVEFFPGVTIEQEQDVLGHVARGTPAPCPFRCYKLRINRFSLRSLGLIIDACPTFPVSFSVAS